MEVIQDKKEQKFFIIIDNLESFVHYNFIDEKTVDFNHTFVPYELRGRGIAKELMDTAKAWITKEKLSERSSCSYARKYFDG